MVIKKVASIHWAGMSDEEKQHYKDLAKKAYEKKLKDWKAGKTQEPSKKKRKSGKPEIDDILAICLLSCFYSNQILLETSRLN